MNKYLNFFLKLLVKTFIIFKIFLLTGILIEFIFSNSYSWVICSEWGCGWAFFNYALIISTLYIFYELCKFLYLSKKR